MMKVGLMWPKREKRKFLVGNTESSTIETIPRKVYLHVTRLKTGTKPDDLKMFLNSKLPGVKCEVHPSRKPELYSSMKVIIDRELLNEAWKRETWPNGSMISFFSMKRRPTEVKDPHLQES
ncbi:hypothetical protein JTB14_003660 [Gonioctena quinquepunctata]|nr:hypothetical protein JTB14_003660 [Gonioctena quinquepunctata]